MFTVCLSFHKGAGSIRPGPVSVPVPGPVREGRGLPPCPGSGPASGSFWGIPPKQDQEYPPGQESRYIPLPPRQEKGYTPLGQDSGYPLPSPDRLLRGRYTSCSHPGGLSC